MRDDDPTSQNKYSEYPVQNHLIDTSELPPIPPVHNSHKKRNLIIAAACGLLLAGGLVAWLNWGNSNNSKTADDSTPKNSEVAETEEIEGLQLDPN